MQTGMEGELAKERSNAPCKSPSGLGLVRGTEDEGKSNHEGAEEGAEEGAPEEGKVQMGKKVHRILRLNPDKATDKD